MIMPLPVKQPGESWYASFDFSRALRSRLDEESSEDVGRILSVEVQDMADGNDVSSDIVDIGICQPMGKTAYVWLKNGLSGHRYKISVRIESSLSKQVFELEAFLIVREY